MFDRLREDIDAFMTHDAAARSRAEIYFLYPGFKAIRRHRKAKWFNDHKMYFLARYISQRTAHKTGIEIHPAAKLGRRVCIDHGSGIVIGETAEIGNDVTIYQGVTLGGTGKETGKRHPTIGNNVMIGSGARVLGPLTIGNNSKIAAGAVVLCDVPNGATVAGVPARIVRVDGEKLCKEREMNQIDIPDPLAQEIAKLECRIKQLEKRIK